MSNVVPLRKRSSSYYAVRKAGRDWAMVLVTPRPGGAIRTALSYFATRQEAVDAGRKAATIALLPFRERAQASVQAAEL